MSANSVCANCVIPWHRQPNADGVFQSRDADKAQGYIIALDNARSEDKWSEVPELVRKVTKHASHRKCLIQTANAEIQVVAHITKTLPATAKGQSTPNHITNLSELIPELIAAIEAADGTPQDIFQAQVCLGWIHWTLSEPGLAVVRLPKEFDDTTIASLSEGERGLTKWTEVCIVKAGYIKSAAQALISNSDAALQTASTVLPRLAIPNPVLVSCPQALHWSELFLSRVAMLASEEVLSNDGEDNDFAIETALKAFRLWSGHPHTKGRDIAASQRNTQNSSSQLAESQLSIWMTYYKILSLILQYGLSYFPLSSGSPRRQLATEIRRVESVCESVLLRETKFPLASDSNPQVEAWTEDIISNWEVLCGPSWRNDDLGEGGQDAISRNVLDILYRASTKTYHSHSILRRLFHVHAALAEFDLAMKALDTYVEIVVSAKDRAEKAAEIGHLESDATLLQTVSEGVLLLCCFGSEEEARKARDLIAILEKYIEKDIADNLSLADNKEESASRVPSQIIALAYRAIGIGLGNWSRWTPKTEARDDIRAEAIENLERSIAPEFESEYDLSTRYALALLLAESRDLDGAISQVKAALTPRDGSALSGSGIPELHQSEERDKIPLWHLLALLLSAKQEFDIAGRTCEAAFDQLPSSVTIPGHNERRNNRESNRKTADLLEKKKDFIQQLQGREKERIIETRMTQLALLEITDGPEVAVNHSDNLLALFATLFEDLELDITKEKASQVQQQQHLGPPKSSAGTVKSFRGSIFGRKRGSKIPDRSSNPAEPVPPLPDAASAIVSPDAPVIRVTPEAVNKTRQGQQQESQPEKENGFINDLDASQNEKDDMEPEAIGIAISEPQLSPTSPTNPKESAKQSLPAVAHNLNHKHEPRPAGHTDQSPEQDVRLPTPHRFSSPTKSLTKFPVLQAQKHAISLLVKVWLLISGMYRRASLFDDALEACEEASKQVAAFEALVAAEESSARAFVSPVWGVAKSTEELWADVHAEKGALSEAQSQIHEAMQYYEEAVSCFPDHPKATIALSNLLLDAWEEKIPLEPVEPRLDSDIVDSSTDVSTSLNCNSEILPDKAVTRTSQESKPTPKTSNNSDEPEYLSRLAARDRAYGLVSMLTKTGAAWDNSEAWYTLSRAYEAGSQIEKAKEILWWCIELEDRKPIRHWWNLGAGGYVL
ncbi:filamentation protein (Rhf1), putative [Talaromyces stipitatus ATCC 10500]|uniref:Filamentation protein (Rhf1), putative n=1 Tax=Talaromyces stipitatus (strain ATCC 10500 / CBS 375.48 / QM 6759 / NRRL 1006) TaxID=441959 RepID=B8MBR1_TALSN|nr:filamentation protein (Rhf1), putative [Talaromyces stipitatus ATCC 10500]EED18194.1 filamentation protein (Rhf1), putative [Talaromyces stipitatus ATCC 10500]